jgi:hypothetical protein
LLLRHYLLICSSAHLSPVRNRLKHFGDTPYVQACTHAVAEASINAAQRFQTVHDTFDDTLLQLGYYTSQRRELARVLGAAGDAAGDAAGNPDVEDVDAASALSSALYNAPPTDVQPGVEDATEDSPTIKVLAVEGGAVVERANVMTGIGLDWHPAPRPQPRRPVELLSIGSSTGGGIGGGSSAGGGIGMRAAGGARSQPAPRPEPPAALWDYLTAHHAAAQ